MIRSKAEFVRAFNTKEADVVKRGLAKLPSPRRDQALLIGWVRANGHERMLYGWKDVKPFTFPRSYGKGPKAPSDKYSEAKAWAQACASYVEAGKGYWSLVEAKNGEMVRAWEGPVIRCPRCHEELGPRYIGWTYAACPECNIIFAY